MNIKNIKAGDIVGATMYYNPDKASPRWAWEKLAYIGSLQGHKFFREVR